MTPRHRGVLARRHFHEGALRCAPSVHPALASPPIRRRTSPGTRTLRTFSHAMAVAAKKKRPPPRTPPKNVVAAARSGGARSMSWRPVWDNVKSLLGAVLIFLVIRTFLIEAYRIPSPSMVPTLLVGDWLFVNKLVYGPHIPFTNINLPGYGAPKRGDVVVFKSPTQIDQPSDPNPTLVKRLIGLPGDTLYMRDDLLFVNG